MFIEYKRLLPVGLWIDNVKDGDPFRLQRSHYALAKCPPVLFQLDLHVHGGKVLCVGHTLTPPTSTVDESETYVIEPHKSEQYTMITVVLISMLLCSIVLHCGVN